MDVVLGVGEFVQFSLALLQLSDLLLDLVQQLLGLADSRLFLGSDQLSHFETLQLDRPNEFSEDCVAFFGCCSSRALGGDTEHARILRCFSATKDRWLQESGCN